MNGKVLELSDEVIRMARGGTEPDWESEVKQLKAAYKSVSAQADRLVAIIERVSEHVRSETRSLHLRLDAECAKVGRLEAALERIASGLGGDGSINVASAALETERKLEGVTK